MRVVGGWLTGGGALDGRVDGLRAAVSPAGVDVAFRHGGVGPDTGHLLAVGIDGDLYELVPGEAGEVQQLVLPGTLGGGEHRVDVVPVRPETRRLPDLHGVAYGRRAYLRWPASDAGDLRRYLVYDNGGDGAVDFGAPVAVVDEVIVHEAWFVEGSGSGSGRMSVRGSWSGARVNAVYTVQAEGGEYRHNVTGEWSEWRPIERGAAVLLGLGVVVVFEDAPSAYLVLSFGVRVGPRREWGSGELAEGTWRFSVRAEDGAGNLSGALTELALAILHLPDAVRDLRGEYHPGGAAPVVLTWTLPPGGGLAGIDIYSNYSVTFGRLTDEIIEDAPFDDVGAADTLYELAPAVEGVWKFWVRTRDAAGRRSASIVTAVVDTEGLPEGVRLNAPEQVAVAAGPGGSFRVSWVYRWAGGEDVVQFQVYEEGDPLVGVGSASPVGGAAASYEVVIPEAYVADQGFVVAAVGPGGVEVLSEVAVGVPDGDAPVLDDPLEGVPN